MPLLKEELMASVRFVTRLIKLVWVSVLTIGLLISSTTAGILISYQGRLLNASGVPVGDGNYNVSFGIFSDSINGDPWWEESATVITSEGLFTHLLGSHANLDASILTDNDPLFLEITVNGQAIAPRTRLTSTASAIVARNLVLLDSNGVALLRTDSDSGGVLQFNDASGNGTIILHGGLEGNDAVVLPNSAVNADEILNEPGIAVSKSSTLIDLSSNSMTDLVTLEITIPEDGYIVLHGKAYVLLSGTTGPNSARVQIDQNEGGLSEFPYYTQAGLSGYVNTGINYFPIYVTRTYYKTAGIHEFRLEGFAVEPLPAIAQSWDHVLTAVYYPTSYGWVSSVVANPTGHPEAIPVKIDDLHSPERSGTYYDVDLRIEENKNSTKSQHDNRD